MTHRQRPLRSDGEATRDRILEAAGEMIAEAGFAATTGKAIAKRADADVASINYHFGSRAGLYQAVLVEAHNRLISIDGLSALAASELSARERLRRLLQLIVGTVTAERGWSARVLGREILSPSSHLQALLDTEVAGKANIVLAILSDITSLPPENPRLVACLINVMSPFALLLLARQNPFPFIEPAIGMPTEALVDHFYTFAIGGLEAVTADRQVSGS